MSERTCIIESCGKPVLARQWCSRHYDRWRKYGDPVAPTPPRKPRPKAPKKQCVIDGCDRPQVARSWCSVHYTRWFMYGDPSFEPPQSVTCAADGCERNTRVGYCVNHRHRLYGTSNHHSVTNDYVDLPDGTTRLTMRMDDGSEFTTVFDTADLTLVQKFRWNVSHQGYVISTGNVRMHRRLLGMRRKDGLTVDHINGDRRDNRRCNLRATTNQRNVAHQAVVNHRGTSRFRNVHRERGTGRWNAEVSIGRQKHWLGAFDTEEAAAARAAAFRVEQGLPSGY